MLSRFNLMLIITFIHSLLLCTTSSARPAESGTPSQSLPFAQNIGTDYASWDALTPTVASNTVPSTVSPDVKPTLQYLATANQREFPDDQTVNSTSPDIISFNTSFAQNDLRAVSVKYSQAERHLKGEDLSTLPNFTRLSEILGNNDPTAQVSGSTFILRLQTYGNDASYYGQFSMGTPPQSVLCNVDTGSADLWVSSDCTNCKSGAAQFVSTASSTYFDTGQPFTLAYGTGEVEGTIAQDTFFAGHMSVRQQYFGAVTKESTDFSNVPYTGIIGMAFSSISTARESTFMERLIQDRRVNVAAFGVHLTRHQPQQSELCIGCYDPSKYISAISWNPVTSQTYWSISLDNVQVGGVNVAPRKITAAIDTGTSLIYLPRDLADALYNQIPGASGAPQFGPGLYTYPCLYHPVVSLTFGARSYEINPRDFNLGRTTVSGDACIGGILATSGQLSPSLAIIGVEFLKSWYSIFDYGDGSRVGFAQSINNR